uniref:G_PROTEIN_RECEP_F1_2 domain-containing protein n=1 Tax=Steinernema glaseri TaxID=37863 RepID=A0A1I7XZT9_9BILA
MFLGAAMHLFLLNDSLARECALNQTHFADGYRLALVGFFGSFVAIVSILANFLLFYVFSTSRKLRRQNYANPVLLALSDIIVSTCYVLMTSMHVVFYRAEFVPLVHGWASYMRFTYCLQHVALTVSNFLLVVASTERYLASNSLHTHKRLLVFMVRRKIYVIAFIVVLSLIFKASLFLETETLYLPECPELMSVIPVWIHSDSFWQSVRFWIRKIFTIIVPFFVLAYCNICIVSQLRKGQRESVKKSLRKSRRGRYNSGSVKRRYNEKKGVRIATKTLVMVVGCYLFSNSLTTVINIWEFFDSDFLRYDHYYAYLLWSDFASLVGFFPLAP